MKFLFGRVLFDNIKRVFYMFKNVYTTATVLPSMDVKENVFLDIEPYIQAALTSDQALGGLKHDNYQLQDNLQEIFDH